MGGYDFPGSNSNIDLHALTGWIPERVSIKVDDPSFNKNAVFKKILERFHKGDVLVTLATGEIAEAEADRAGEKLAVKLNEMNPFKVFIFIHRKLFSAETFQDYFVCFIRLLELYLAVP
jgi:hypothetical protein